MQIKHVVILVMLVAHTQVLPQATGPFSWPTQFTPQGNLKVMRFEKGNLQEIDLSNIELDPSFLGKRNPLPSYFAVEPDYKAEILRSGIGRLKRPGDAPKHLREAEEAAKRASLGIWKPQDAAKPSASALPPVVSAVAKTSPAPAGFQWPTWAEIKDWISVWGGIGAILASLGGALAFANRSARKKKVVLLLFGLPSTGKTWISMRLADPDMTSEKLSEHKERTRSVQRTREPLVHVHGRYEVRHLNVDVPGANPGDQLAHLLSSTVGGRFGRHIWLITLATTQDASTTYESPTSQKIDHAFIAEQFGHLNLLLAVLQRYSKPELIVVILAKVDLFCKTEPQTNATDPGAQQLSSLFARHVAALKNECDRTKVPFLVEHCSALYGWKVESLRRHIHRKLFDET